MLPRAVKNGVASVQAHAVVEGVLALGLPLVTRIGDPAVRLEENGRSKVLLLVPPVRGAGCRAAGAENAFVETVELLAVVVALLPLLGRRRRDGPRRVDGDRGVC